MISDWIDIFDGEKMIGSVEVEIDFPNSSVIQLIDVTVNDKKTTIMYIKGMNYGIIIPEHISEKMKEACVNE